ncbi:hypothetical protein PLICRDRAFT_43933 [Plicaturopsis crispa FD-325 SS-3]|nr:hypothetical protein PLICRDRAFT_43933 [Plicaturopsis crispa FD-325 SS-3]
MASRPHSRSVAIPARRTSITAASIDAAIPMPFAVPVSSRHSRTAASPSTYEPRIIRAQSTDAACLPSGSAVSTSPSRARVRTRTPSTSTNVHKRSPSNTPGAAVASTSASFPRPTYLDNSALRHLLRTAPTPSTIPSPAPPTRRRTSPLDSDDESSASPPPPEVEVPILRVGEGETDIPLPTRWSETVRHPSLSVSADGRELAFNGPTGSIDKDAAAARTVHPIPAACGVYYYEVDIVSKGTKGHISIGFAARDVRLSRLPGWEKNSWGYHGDDGYAFAAERGGKPFGSKFGTGDVIGCGLDFTNGRAFYTRNGLLIGSPYEFPTDPAIALFPSVGLRHTGEAVRANFGQAPFRFDIEDFAGGRRKAVWSAIMHSGPAAEGQKEKEAETLRTLVLGYLAHHGHVRTARAFQAQCRSSAEDVDMDTGAPSSVLEAEMATRTRIVQLVRAGSIDTALTLLSEQETSGGGWGRIDEYTLMQLRCRKFVELVLDAAVILRGLNASRATAADAGHADRVLKYGAGVDGHAGVEGNGSMDVDDDASSSALVASPSAPTSTAYEAALSRAIAYGQTLQASPTPLPPALLRRTFGIVAYPDPERAGGEVAEIVGDAERARLAEEVNAAILRAQGKPTCPALERAYRQASACATQLVILGEGRAAYADLRREMLEE